MDILRFSLEASAASPFASHTSPPGGEVAEIGVSKLLQPPLLPFVAAAFRYVGSAYIDTLANGKGSS